MTEPTTGYTSFKMDDEPPTTFRHGGDMIGVGIGHAGCMIFRNRTFALLWLEQARAAVVALGAEEVAA